MGDTSTIRIFIPSELPLNTPMLRASEADWDFSGFE